VSQTKRSISLDVLRCVAVLLVLFRDSDTPLQWGGWIGVDLFFVLSGFLVSGLIFREYQRTGDVDANRFLVRRGFKIYPSFWVMLAATLAVDGVTDAQRTWGELLFMQNYIGGLWPHTWSLAVEEHFYIGLALCVAFTKRFRLVPALFVLVAVACLAQRFVMSYHGINLYWTNFRIDSLLFGVLISYYWHFKGVRLTRYRWPLLITGCLLLVPFFLFDSANNIYVFVYGLTVIYIAAGMILIGMLNFHPPLKWMAKVGMYSYSIYLWHMFVHRYIENPLLFFIVSIAFGVLMGVAIEYPLLALRDRFSLTRVGRHAMSPSS
jgi:peptidoglycan/LPS O-acetylase OafA/YrhL